MIDRCTNPNNKAFANYGGRGITVSQEWRESFETFLADVGRKPSKAHSLDRIDNSKGYCKENCRWADQYEQAQNRRNTRWITVQGKTLCIAQWGAELGIDYRILHHMLTHGFVLEQAWPEVILRRPSKS